MRMVGVIGRLGVYPMCRLAIPARRLLVYLAVNSRVALRSEISAGLWPDFPEEVGRANLRRALWLTPPRWIHSESDQLELNASVDYEQAKASAVSALKGRELSIEEINLLSSDLLEGWNEEWLIQKQDAFRLLRVQALESVCINLAKVGQFALAAQAGAAALAAEPLRESAAAALIDAHLSQNNRHEAILCFTKFAKRLDVELGVKPDADLCDRVAGLKRAAG